MRKSKFSETQIVGILKDAESGVPVADLLRQARRQQGDVLQVAQQVRRGVGVGREAAAGARGGERQAETDVRGPGARERGDQGRAQPKAVRPSAKRQVARGAGARAPAAGAAGLSRGEALAGGVLPASGSGESARCRGDRGADGRRGAVSALGLLEAVSIGCASRASAWNHKHVHRVYCALRLNLPRRTTRRVPRRIRQPLDGAAGAEPDLGARLHDGDALRRPARPAADDHRRRQSRGPGDRDGPLAPESSRGARPRRARRPPRPAVSRPRRQRPRIHRAALRRLVRRARRGDRTTSSRASRIRTRTSNASIAAIGPRC